MNSNNSTSSVTPIDPARVAYDKIYTGFNAAGFAQFKKGYDAAKEDDREWRKRFIKVTFADGDTMETEINGTVFTIQQYYIGKTFNIAKGPNDYLVKAVSVEFLG